MSRLDDTQQARMADDTSRAPNLVDYIADWINEELSRRGDTLVVTGDMITTAAEAFAGGAR